MLRSAFHIALLGAAGLAAAASAQMPAPQTQAVSYLAMAGESDVFEITSSQVAMMRSQNPDVRAMAMMLIDHHSRTTSAALTAAKAAGVMPPPPVLSTQYRAMIAQLQSTPAADFDRLYLQQQLPAHEAALALHQGYAEAGDEAPLRATAKAAVPIVESHLAKARTLAAR